MRTFIKESYLFYLFYHHASFWIKSMAVDIIHMGLGTLNRTLLYSGGHQGKNLIYRVVEGKVPKTYFVSGGFLKVTRII